MKRFIVAAALVGFAHFPTQVAAAQDPIAGSVDLDATLGAAAGGAYVQRGSVGLDLLGALRLREISSGAWIAAFDAEIRPSIGGGDKCLIVKTGTGCAPDFPSLTTWSALAGWESGRAGQASLRLLVGPSVYSASGSASLGATVRADIATPTLVHFALAATGRRSFVSTLLGGATGLWAAGIGVRLR